MNRFLLPLILILQLIIVGSIINLYFSTAKLQKSDEDMAAFLVALKQDVLKRNVEKYDLQSNNEFLGLNHVDFSSELSVLLKDNLFLKEELNRLKEAMKVSPSGQYIHNNEFEDELETDVRSLKDTFTDEHAGQASSDIVQIENNISRGFF